MDGPIMISCNFIMDKQKSQKNIRLLPLRKAFTPFQLNKLLGETTKAIVGLDFVYEIIACSNSEADPYYECALCGNHTFRALGMIHHLKGNQHRVKFLQNKYPKNLKY